MKAPRRKHLTLVDGHVHIHESFLVREFFGHAQRNFTRAAAALNCDACTPVLALTESADSRWFEWLASRVNEAVEGWSVVATGEACSLEVRDSDRGHRIFVTAGSQIVTAENLEVLSLFSLRRVQDGLPVEEVIDRILAFGGVPVIPWGFGKWWGVRGRVVRELVSNAAAGSLRFGDNGSRTRWLPTPALLRQARNLGIQVLSGSDPLPFPGEVHKPGRYGFGVDIECSNRPAASLLSGLTKRHLEIIPFGTLESGVRFSINQLRMQLRKAAG